MWAATCLASCCASCACEACKSVVGGISRKSARIAYCGLFALSLVISWVLREVAAPLMEKIPWINHFESTPDREWFETEAVLRVSLGNFLFFTILAVLMMGVKNQSDPRDRLHHGGWTAKVFCWFVLVALMFFLPNRVISFYETISKFGSGFFLLVQVVLLLDFVHAWNENWVSRDEQFWYVALLVVALVCYVATFSFSVVLFHFFTISGQDCSLNIFFLIITLILVFVFAIVALHPKINGSLLPAYEKNGLRKGSWTEAEDVKLVTYILRHGYGNWRALPKQAGLLRCGKSCRLRWVNYLRPDIKRGNFSKEEEDTIIRLHQFLGNKWSDIASKLPGRTDNEIKNVWNTRLKKRLISILPPQSLTSSITCNPTDNIEINQYLGMKGDNSMQDALDQFSTEIMGDDVLDRCVTETDEEENNNNLAPFQQPIDMSWDSNNVWWIQYLERELDLVDSNNQQPTVSSQLPHLFQGEDDLTSDNGGITSHT